MDKWSKMLPGELMKHEAKIIVQKWLILLGEKTKQRTNKLSYFCRRRAKRRLRHIFQMKGKYWTRFKQLAALKCSSSHVLSVSIKFISSSLPVCFVEFNLTDVWCMKMKYESKQQGLESLIYKRSFSYRWTSELFQRSEVQSRQTPAFFMGEMKHKDTLKHHR